MTGTLGAVALAALAFVGSHLLLSSRPVRAPLIRALGEQGFRGLYTVVAFATIFWLAMAYNAAPHSEVWPEPAWGRATAGVLLLVAAILVVFGASSANPTMVGAERRASASAASEGIFAVTRHPMMWGFALFGFAHMIVNGDAASLILFGGIALLALVGMAHIDARRRAAGGEDWARFAAATSAIPFAALAAGRARFTPRAFLGWRLAAALALYAALIALHGPVIGPSAFPGWIG